MALHIAQVQKAQSKAPVPAGLRQANQQIGNPLILLIQLRYVAIASLAHAERPASKSNTYTLLDHSVLGQFTTLAWPRY